MGTRKIIGKEGHTRHRVENKNTMEHTEIGWEGVNWNHVSQDR